MNSNNRSSILFGVLIVLIGVSFLFNTFGADIAIGSIISTYWPVILIIWGIDNILQGKKHSGNNSHLIFSIIILIIGIILLGNKLNIFQFDLSIIWKLIWPALLIFIGISILIGARKTGDTGWAIMGGIEKKSHGWSLKNKSYIAFMGGVELDLTRAKIPEGETFLDLTAVMGGIDIKAPANLNIILNETSFLGGVQFFKDGSGGILSSRKFERIVDNESDKKLIISCRAIMGGIDIKEAN